MKNITISMDDDLARWTRIEAARREQSISRFLAELLRNEMKTDETYEKAMKAFLTVKPRPLGKPGEKYPVRDEIYDRPVLRR